MTSNALLRVVLGLSLLFSIAGGCRRIAPYGPTDPSPPVDTSLAQDGSDASVDSLVSRDTVDIDVAVADTVDIAVADIADIDIADTRVIPDMPVCSKPSSTCWDVSAVFTKTEVNWPSYSPKIFGSAVTDNQTIFALFDGGNDSTYTEPSYTPIGTCYSWLAKNGSTDPFNTAQTWHIERKSVDTNTYDIFVRGSSYSDCSNVESTCSGEFQVNLSRGWKIIKTLTCTVNKDSTASYGTQIPTYCTVDKSSAKVS